MRRVLAGWRSLPLVVRAATGGFAGLMLAMMYLYPVNYGFDEPQHFDMAYAYAQGHGPYAPGQRNVSLGVINESNAFTRGYPPRLSLADNPIISRSQRLSVAGYGGDTQIVAVPNQMVQHPPLYYLLGAAVLAVPGVSSLHYDIQFTLLRLLSLLILLPLPWLCYATARRLGVGDLAPAASLMPLLLPALARNGASVTNDSLMTLSCGVVLYLIVRVVTGDTGARTARWMAVWLVIALLTKGFALLLPVLAVLAYLVSWRRYGVNVLKSLIIVCAGAAVGGLWWAHNYVAYGRVQPDGFGIGYVQRKYLLLHPGPERGKFSTYVHELWTSLVDRFWGSIGLIEAPDFNWTFAALASIVLGGLVLVALARGLGGRGGRIALAVPLLMPVLTVVLIASSTWADYHRYVLLAGAQGRYLFPAVPVVAAVAMLGLGVFVRGRAQRVVAPALVTVAAYTQLWTLRTVVHAWWITDKPVPTLSAWRNAIHAIANWAPWSVGVTVVVGAAVVVLEARLVYAAFAGIRKPEPVTAVVAGAAVTA